MLSVIKFFHVLCGITFFGITIASFFYIARSINKQERPLIDYSITASYVGDAMILLCILVQMITSPHLVSAGHFNLNVPWIFIAYLAFYLLIVLWISMVVIKKYYLSKIIISHNAIKAFYFLNIAMILIFIIIIHDAVTHSTGLEFLFKE